MKQLFYIAYGSDLNMAQMANRCPNAEPVGTGYLNNYQLVFKGDYSGSYLTIEPADGKRVPVGIWKLKPGQRDRLDKYEGWPKRYNRRDFLIDMKAIEGKDRTKIKAFAYIMRSDVKKAEPSRMFLDVCVQGYKDFKFNKLFLEEAIALSK